MVVTRLVLLLATAEEVAAVGAVAAVQTVAMKTAKKLKREEKKERRSRHVLRINRNNSYCRRLCCRRLSVPLTLVVGLHRWLLQE